jgi:hypothetical protein
MPWVAATETTIFILIAGCAQLTGAAACFDVIFVAINAVKITSPDVTP